MMPTKTLLFTEDSSKSRTEVESLGGQVIHQFTPSVFVALLPEGVSPALLRMSTSQGSKDLSRLDQLAVDSWAAYQQKMQNESLISTEGLSWDSDGYEAPRTLSPDSPYSQDQGLSPSNISGYNEGVEITGSESFGRDPQESPQAPLSSCMIGSVAVGIIIVSGDSGEEKFSDEEQSKIIQEVQEGLDWLATVEPKAKLSFSYDIQQIVVSASPGPYTEETDEYEQWERDWRDAALAELGYQTGYQGYQKYASDLRDRRGTKWAYVTFFTKYPLHHFAYSIYSKVVMSYDNDGWGPDSLNRVFAHESCHIFGALDEYGSCRCESVGGQLSGPNGNCINCLPREQQLPCVMNANTLKMCDYTRKQIGWDDSLFP